MTIKKQIPYHYEHAPIPGGGYVTGFVFHPQKPDVLYARTDIGGVYRYDYEMNKWKSLIDHVTQTDLSESYPIAIGLNTNQPECLLIACGVNKENKGVLAISQDGGKSFTYENIPTLVHGNLNGRGTGLKLIVDAQEDQTIYFASQQGGLLRSKDLGKSWESLEVQGEKYMTFVWQSKDAKTLVVGTAGVTTKQSDKERGHSLYVSYDGGSRFEKLWQPEKSHVVGSRMSGYVAQRYDDDGNYLYITFSETGRRSYVKENGYSCDSGDALAGRIIRYERDTEGKIISCREITPYRESETNEDLEYGFSGISACKTQPGLLVATTLCKDDGDCIYRSFDYGEHWETVLDDLKLGNLSFVTSYMKPEYNGGHSILHWLSDIKINPFNGNEVWFNSGTGIFGSKDLMSTLPHFQDYTTGIEETVHLNVYSPPAGKVKLIDILGDLGGFAFEDLKVACDNSFADTEGNRYITCINADYSDLNPEVLVVTARGNWTGKTKGGLILSKDQGKTFERLKMPYGLSKEIDEKLRYIEQPNVNAGWIALSPDCDHLVWSIADNIELPMRTMIHSEDGGKSFKCCEIYNLENKRINHRGMKVFADRMNSRLMYGFDSEGSIYISKDSGASFKEYPVNQQLKGVNFALIDCANQTEIRGESGKEGIFYMALREKGLWKMQYDAREDQLSLKKLSDEDEIIYRIGLGVIRPNGDYFKEDKALYICGDLKGGYGFYRSLDEGKTWVKLNTEHQMFGDINSIEGDSRTFGRFFIATGSRGVLYGEPISEEG